MRVKLESYVKLKFKVKKIFNAFIVFILFLEKNS